MGLESYQPHIEHTDTHQTFADILKTQPA